MEPSMRSVDTPLLRIGYEEWNASAQRTVVLLHRLAGLPSSAARKFGHTHFKDQRRHHE